VLKGNSGIGSEMALRLSKALGRSPESWLTMQDNYDLWQARKTINLEADWGVTSCAGWKAWRVDYPTIDYGLAKEL